MIARYSLPEMSKIWNQEAQWDSWADVEKAHLKVLLQNEKLSTSQIEEILVAFSVSVKSCTPEDFLKRELETGHDVIAFVSKISEAFQKTLPTHLCQYHVFVHKGLTSSDILDTALSLRINNSLHLILESLTQLRGAFSVQAFAHAQTVCIGRTHGIHAEPMSFGHVLAGHFQDFQNSHINFLSILKKFQFGKLSGAVGNYSQLQPCHEESVLNELGLKPELVATQVLSRQKFSQLGQAFVVLSGAIERFAQNMRHWARTELGEVLEPFSEKQKGSSAMPHKKNPILSENLCGLSKTVRNYCHALEENVALWHERDISHSSVERMVLPDIFVTSHFIIERTRKLVEQMIVRPDVMLKQVQRTGGLWASQSVLTLLVNKGISRNEAYEKIQSHALPISQKVALFETGLNLTEPDFYVSLKNDSEIMALKLEAELKECFNTNKFLNSVNFIFTQVFGLSSEEFERKWNLCSKKVEHDKKQKLCFAFESVPALQKVYAVCVELRKDILDTESLAIEIDFQKQVSSVLSVRQNKTFFVRLPGNMSHKTPQILSYARETLHNEVMEQIEVEVVQ
jgi:adenylosuccinate lyase